MAPTIRLAEYLFTRLRQLGVGSVHGVPGDYNLKLLDYVVPSRLRWVGNANELNAGYAADGYARIKGLGALVTTFGVGELSAINAIAGAYAERAPVVHIVGTPERASQDARLLIHHTFCDGNYRRFAQMHSHVTVAQANLSDSQTSPEKIDRVLKECLLQSRPVYIELPVDMVEAPVSTERLDTEISLPEFQESAPAAAALTAVLEAIYAAKQPVILVDGETRALGIMQHVQELAMSLGWPTWTTAFGKGLVDETSTNFHGVYAGSFGDPQTQKFIDGADLVLCFGPHFSSTNTYLYSTIPRPEASVLISDTEVKVRGQSFRDVYARQMMPTLLQKLDVARAKKTYASGYPNLPSDQHASFSEVESDKPITQDKFWRIAAGILRPGDIVLGETGTSGYGVREMRLPQHTRVFTPVTWLSIGFMLPGAQGAALAQAELIAEAAGRNGGDQGANTKRNPRTVLFIGDGSFQMTAQELGTMVRHNLDVVVFLLNNRGFTIERCLHGLRQEYNDVASWRYLEAPRFFGAPEDTFTARVQTWGELERAVADLEARTEPGLKMIEVAMDVNDVPKGPLDYFMKLRLAEEKELGGRG